MSFFNDRLLGLQSTKPTDSGTTANVFRSRSALLLEVAFVDLWTPTLSHKRRYSSL